MSGKSKKGSATLEAISNIYNTVPSFTDMFDEESFYLFAGLFTLVTILVAFAASRFVTLKERD